MEIDLDEVMVSVFLFIMMLAIFLWAIYGDGPDNRK
jgi:hypothetical protein